jgi:hypothetical protein
VAGTADVILVKFPVAGTADVILVKFPVAGTADVILVKFPVAGSDIVIFVVRLANEGMILDEFIVPSTSLPSIIPEGLVKFNNETST